MKKKHLIKMEIKFDSCIECLATSGHLKTETDHSTEKKSRTDLVTVEGAQDKRATLTVQLHSNQ